MKSIRIKPSQRAVTLTELLVVMAIVSILATLAVPVYVSQMHRARVATAQAEVRTIAEAQQMVAVTHGFYVPIHVLDNVPDPPPGGGTGGTGERDNFEDMGTGGRWVIDATRSLQAQFEDGGTAELQIQLSDTSTNNRVRDMIEQWQGPFLNPRRVRFVGENPNVPGSGDLNEDLVVDPWGNPYRMYTDLGLVGDAGLPSTNNQDITLTMDNGRISSSSSEEVDRFDRFAIVSYGPNGRSGFTGNPLDQGDDVYYTWSGIAGNETTYQSF